VAEVLRIDFETRSRVDLKKAGVYRYATDPSTQVLCKAWAFDDEEPEIWTPFWSVGGRAEFRDIGPFKFVLPERVLDHIRSGGEIRGWNVAFERVIWKLLCVPRYGWPHASNDQFTDTMAEALSMALPGSLDRAARALNTLFPKDDEGHRLMMQLSKPRKPSKKDARVWWDEWEKFERLFTYCKQDVRAERAIERRLRRLSDHERSIYLLDQRINDRGVMLDMPLVRAASELAELANERANEEMLRLTNGEVSSVTKVKGITTWLQKQGIEIDNLRKDTLRDLVAGGDLIELHEEVVTLRSDSAKASVKKIAAMLACACKDARARGLLAYHTASTGRWAGRLIQPQNFPGVKHAIKDIEGYIPLVLRREYDLIAVEYPVLALLAAMLRSMFKARKGYRFMSGDFSQIEARVLAWIAGQTDLVEAFANGGKIYEKMAAYIKSRKEGREVHESEIAKDSVERDLGKKTVLGCGFQMGPETFQKNSLKESGVLVPIEDCELAVTGYRELYPMIPKFWRDINAAAIRAVLNPGVVVEVGEGAKIKYVMRGKFLWCVLPSGRALCYALPRVEKVKRIFEHKDKETGEVRKSVVWKDTLAFWGVDGQTKQWKKFHAYGGLLTENVVQAMARDIMAASMLRVDKAGYPVVLTCHDEVLAEVPNEFGTHEEYMKLMLVRPRWAKGLPVAAEGWEGARYKK
jgi:DNA polymerase